MTSYTPETVRKSLVPRVMWNTGRLFMKAAWLIARKKAGYR